jgi:hypothetical protein
MGAAQYNGVPSPDLAARLDQARDPLPPGYAKLIMVTGNKEPGDVYTESQAGARYLEKTGVPAGDILRPGERQLREHRRRGAQAPGPGRPRWSGHHRPLPRGPLHGHCVRAEIDAVAHPHPDLADQRMVDVPYFLKEALGVGLGRIIGYNHLEWLHDA